MVTPGVRFLLIATGVAFLLQLVFNAMTRGGFTLVFGLSLWGIKHLFLWQPVTYLFLHGGFLHIIFNMIGLFFFGPETERVMGTRRFLLLYFSCGIIGGLGWLLISGSGNIPCIGASGAIFGILGAFAALFPDRSITLLVFFVLPVTMKARTLAIGLALFNLISMISVPGHIAYAAHLTGGLVGYGYTCFKYKQYVSLTRLNPMQWLNDLKWRWQRRNFKVISSSQSGFGSDVHPSIDEVNEILDKVSKNGIHSLTDKEREILEKASKKH